MDNALTTYRKHRESWMALQVVARELNHLLWLSLVNPLQPSVHVPIKHFPCLPCGTNLPSLLSSSAQQVRAMEQDLSWNRAAKQWEQVMVWAKIDDAYCG